MTLAQSVLFPFINMMLEELLPEVDKARIGSYTGFVVRPSATDIL